MQSLQPSHLMLQMMLECWSQIRASQFLSAPLAAARVEAWLEGLLLLLALAGSQVYSAPPPSRVLCCRLCLPLTEKKNRHGKKWPYIPCFPPGQLALLRNASAARLVLDTCTCWFVSVCSLRLLPPTLGLAWMGRWRGALPWRGACLSLFHSLASRREAKLCSVTGPNTI